MRTCLVCDQHVGNLHLLGEKLDDAAARTLRSCGTCPRRTSHPIRDVVLGVLLCVVCAVAKSQLRSVLNLIIGHVELCEE